VLNRTADHARYAVDFTADVQIRFTPGGLLSGGGTLVKFEEQAVGDVSMPRNQAADFELHAFGALKHTAIDAPDEVYVPAHEHGGGVGVRPEIDIPGPVAVRPARLDVDQPTERNDLLPAYLSRGIMGEGFGKLVSLPGSERVLDTIRTGITTMLREARVKPTQAQWRDFENNAAMHY